MAKPAKAFGNFFTAGASTSQAIAEQAKWRLRCLNLKKSDKLIIFLLQKRYKSVTLAASDSCKERKRMNNNLSFANRLGTLRSERGLSKSGLARAVHVSTTCVWNWEEGNTFPRPEALARIATALGTTPAYLERGEPPSSSDRDQVSSDTGPDKVDSAHSNLAEIVRTARAQIATAAGLELGQVKIILEYGS